MVKPLTFKGDKKSGGGSAKKRKRHDLDLDDKFPNSSTSLIKHEPNADTHAATGVDGDEDFSWVSAETAGDISGPVLIVLPTSPPTCLACDSNGKTFTSSIENIVSSDPTTAEPHDVRQVWVANRVAGTEHFSFKGHHGRYLGCDKFGVISATKEAISPEESFRCIEAPDTLGGFALETQRDTFLTIDGDYGDSEHEDTSRKLKSQSSAPSVRGDAGAITFNCTFRLRMQARFKPRLKASKAEKAKEKISRKELEEAVGRRLEDEEVKTLKRARREGNYHEALLNVKHFNFRNVALGYKHSHKSLKTLDWSNKSTFSIKCVEPLKRCSRFKSLLPKELEALLASKGVSTNPYKVGGLN